MKDGKGGKEREVMERKEMRGEGERVQAKKETKRRRELWGEESSLKKKEAESVGHKKVQQNADKARREIKQARRISRP